MSKHHSKEEMNAKIKSLMTSNKETFSKLHTISPQKPPKTKNKEKVIKMNSED